MIDHFFYIDHSKEKVNLSFQGRYIGDSSTFCGLIRTAHQLVAGVVYPVVQARKNNRLQFIA